jgi:hydrolase, NUDIX family
LPLWEGDKIFLDLLAKGRGFFSLTLRYDREGSLKEAILDGKEKLISS